MAENPPMSEIFEDIRRVNNLNPGEPITISSYRTWLHLTIGGFPSAKASTELLSVSRNPSLKDDLFKECPPPPPSPGPGRRNLHLPPAPAPM